VDLPEHDTLLPASPEASSILPAPDEPGDTLRVEAPPVPSSSALLDALAALWPELQAVAHWWQERQSLAQQDDAPDRQLTRQTYHVEQRYIDAVKQEADRTGESPAAVVNRAFARYFAGR
jgi:thiamine pyrophosphate-dependent acetolactate synthase large subunit-like protein